MGVIILVGAFVVALALHEGGNWNNSAYCSSGSRTGNNTRSTLNDNNSAQGVIRISRLTTGNIDMTADNYTLSYGQKYVDCFNVSK